MRKPSRLASMVGRPELLELHRLLHDELTRRFTAEGWVVDPARYTEPGQLYVAAFRRPIATDYAIAANFRSNEWGAERELEVPAGIGVSYEPAYRLWPVVFVTEFLEHAVPLSHFRGRADDSDVRLSRPSEVEGAAEMLVEPIFEHGIEWASQYTSVEALLEANRGQTDPYSLREPLVVPVILAGAGRLEEARSALDDYLASGRARVRTREYKNFAYRLNNWIDAGGVLPDPPTEPFGERHASRVRSPEEQRREAPARRKAYEDERRNTQEALDEVRAQDAGRDREQVKEMLEEELAKRGRTNVRPLELENLADKVNPPPPPRGLAGQFQANLGFKVLVRIGTALYKEIRHSPNGPPDWMVPPGRAGYKARKTLGAYVGVKLDPDVTDFLRRVMATTAPGPLNSIAFEVWLAWDPEPRADDSLLAVHIGEQRVGVLDAVDAEVYLSDMEAAERRGELPYLVAALTARSRDPAFVLELQASPME